MLHPDQHHPDHHYNYHDHDHDDDDDDDDDSASHYDHDYYQHGAANHHHNSAADDHNHPAANYDDDDSAANDHDHSGFRLLFDNHFDHGDPRLDHLGSSVEYDGCPRVHDNDVCSADHYGGNPRRSGGVAPG